MATALEFGLEPDLHHAVDEPIAQQVGRKAEHVGVVVQAAHFGRQIVVAGGGPDAGELVGHDAHPHARSADQDAPLDFPGADRRRDLGRVVGIVDALRAFGAEIETFVPQLGEPGKNFPLTAKPR